MVLGGMTNPFQVTVRAETENDYVAINEVIDKAFHDMPYADGDESELVTQLRTERALVVSLVAEHQKSIVGHIAFSPARATDDSEGWFALGPVAVLPRYQARGIGSDLVLAGINRIEKMGAVGCILTGNPNYYTSFGFKLSPMNTPPNEPEQFFMVKLLGNHEPKGPIYFHEAFSAAP